MFVWSLLTILPLLVAAAPASTKEEAIWDRLGNLSPYHPAPVPSGMNVELPGDCKVEQIMYLGRHGSRYPLASELVYIQNLTYKLGNASAAVARAKLPKSMQFLKEGYRTTLGHDDLTAPGRLELFKHGVNFRLKYPQFNATSILAGGQDRVIESAQWFANGYYGRTWLNISSTVFSEIAENNVTVSWITPMDTCPKWDYNYGNNATIKWGSIYLPPITKRLNSLLPGVNLTDNDTHGALYACAYDLAAYDVSPWCNVFTTSEIQNFEYELDLLMDGAFGYNLPGDMGPLLGSLYVHTLIDRFSNSSAEPVYLEFGHDTTIDMALTALGLAKDTPPLSATGPVNPNRKFRTSTQVPFAAQMLWEKFACSSTFQGPQIRLVLNDAPFPLSTCAQSKTDKTYGTCSFDAFVAANNFSTSVTWGDSAWNSTCGNPGF